jgi:hypothetical protein
MSVVDTLVEVRLKNAEDFLKIKETLSRIGVASKKDQILYQSCHILHKKGKYYITHFKELFLLDGKASDFDENDRGRRNTIVDLLEEWGLLEVVSTEKVLEPKANLSQIKIIAYKEKDDWTLIPKYTIGKKKTV